jgi:glycosyltransferase involved in cell wall biosynthesis
MNWLFVTSRFPWPLTHGTWLRVYHLAKSLCALGESVKILAGSEDQDGEKAYVAAGIRCTSVRSEAANASGRAREWYGPYVFDSALAGRVKIAAGAFDVMVLVGPTGLQYSAEAAGAKRAVCDMVDDPLLEERRKLWREPGLAKFVRRVRFLLQERAYEKRHLPGVSAVFFVSGQDADSFRGHHASARVTVVPNGVDGDYFAIPNGMDRDPKAPPTVVLTGNIGFPPNEDAAMYLAEEVAPLVWRTAPDCRFVIAGDRPSERVKALAGERVQVTGWVDDIRPVLWQATVAILPMRIGTGIKNKLLEAWAAGAAVVATPMACQGVPAVDGQNLLLGGSAEALASGVVRLIQDAGLRGRLGANGRLVVAEQFSWKTVAEMFRRQIAGDVVARNPDQSNGNS